MTYNYAISRSGALLRRALSQAGIDAEGLLGILARVASSVCYLTTALLSAIFLTPHSQGLFFTFLSFAALNVLVELGLSTVIIQFTAHEMAARDAAGDDVARARAISRLRSIGRVAFTWFWGGAAIFAVVLGTGGYIFFADVPGANAALPGPWLALVALVTIDLLFFPCWSLLEGGRQIRIIYGYRLAKSILMGVGTWTALIAGWGLWAVPAGFVAVLPLSVGVLVTNWDFFRTFLASPDQASVGWKKEMFPLHWRIALSWISGYVSVWAVTPISLKMFGSVIAGEVGITWTLASGIGAVASAIVMVKFARYGYLVATRRFDELDRSVLRQGAMSVAIAVLGALVVLGGDWIALRNGNALAHRLLPFGAVALFMVGAVAQQITLPMATYLRAFKREPFLWLSVMSAVLLVTAIVAFGKWFGVWGIAIGYAGVMTLYLIPTATMIFVRCRRAWTATA